MMTAAEFHECIARAQTRLQAMATIEPDEPYDVMAAAAFGLAMLATPNIRDNEAAANMPMTNVYILSLLGIHVSLAEIEQFAADVCGPAH